MSSQNIIIDVPSIAFTLGTFYLTQHLQILKIVDPFSFHRIMNRIITYPTTDTIKKESNFIRFDDQTNDENDDDELVHRIKEDVNLKIIGCASDCSIIVGGLFKWKDDFMTNAMDNIIITKYGIGVLNVKYKLKGNNRTIRIDLIKYNDEVLSNRMYICYALTAMTALIVSNGNIRNLLQL
jgi:hypothetical protein